jgi:hypothetical protein
MRVASKIELEHATLESLTSLTIAKGVRSTRTLNPNRAPLTRRPLSPLHSLRSHTGRDSHGGDPRHGAPARGALARRHDQGAGPCECCSLCADNWVHCGHDRIRLGRKPVQTKSERERTLRCVARPAAAPKSLLSLNSRSLTQHSR